MDLDKYHKLLKFTPSNKQPAPPYGPTLVDTKNEVDLTYVQDIYYDGPPPPKTGGGTTPVVVIELV
jgi:hypothetical protein